MARQTARKSSRPSFGDKSLRQLPLRKKGVRDPEATRAGILHAAIQEFSREGYGGARVEKITRRANSNERSLYYHYGSKEGLYVAALEHLYEKQMLAEQALDLGKLDPRAALKTLISFTWRYYQDNPEWLSLLNTENLYKAAHLRKSRRVKAIASPKIGLLEELLVRGTQANVFRRDVTADYLFLTISSLCYLYLSNRYTLSNYLAQDLDNPRAKDSWLAHVTQVVMDYLLIRSGEDTRVARSK